MTTDEPRPEGAKKDGEVEPARGQLPVAPEVGEVLVKDVLQNLSNIDPQLAGVLQRHPPQQLKAVIQASVSKVSQHQSFLPPADEAEAWARIYPNAPERMFDLADRRMRLSERQLEASVEASSDTRDKNQTYRLWGLGAGLLVAGGFLAAGTVMTIFGGSVVGGVIVDVFGVGAGMVTAFIHGRPLLDQNTRFRPSQIMKKKDGDTAKAVAPPSGQQPQLTQAPTEQPEGEQPETDALGHPDRVSL